MNFPVLIKCMKALFWNEMYVAPVLNEMYECFEGSNQNITSLTMYECTAAHQ